MLQACLLDFRRHKPLSKQVGSLIFRISSFSKKSPLQDFQQLSLSSTKVAKPIQVSSSVTYGCAERAVKSVSLRLWDAKGEVLKNPFAKVCFVRLSHSFPAFSGAEKTIKSESLSLWGKKCEILHNPFVKDCFLKLSYISPAVVRRYWRVSVLKPHDVLEILVGFRNDSGNLDLEVRKIESLWGIYKWASKQSRDFKHLPEASNIIASMLVHAELFNEAEYLVSLLDSQGTFLDNHEIYSNLIKVFLHEHQLEKAIAYYDRMRMRGLTPSISCYRVLIEFLVQINETQLAFQMYTDAIDNGFGENVGEGGIYEGVVKILCAGGKILDARNVVKKGLTFGIEPKDLVLNSVASGYCYKRDYDDLLSFFVEIGSKPDVSIVNKLIHSVCRHFGVAGGNSYMVKLDKLGFSMNEITLGILIGWACREGKLKDAFFFLSEIFSRNLTPHLYSYEAILSVLFKEGMWKNYQHILQEMDDQGVEPGLSTFKVLLAGFCKARQFDEVNTMVSQMVNRGLIQLSPTKDSLSGAFELLGLDSSSVKIRRDNDMKFHKAEFFDNLGNALYLDTDVARYERAIDKVLHDAMLPDFNMNNDTENARMLINEMTRWGQEISLCSLDALVKEGLCGSRFCIRTVSGMLEKASNLTYQLDEEILNELVQKCCKMGFVYRARAIFNGMLGRNLRLDSKTYSVLLMSLCKKGDLKSLTSYWKLAQANNWLPDLEDGKALFSRLCRRSRLNDALELFKTLLVLQPNEVPEEFPFFLEELSHAKGSSGPVKVLAKEILSQQGCTLSYSAHSRLLLVFCKWRSFQEAAVICDSMLIRDWVPPLDASVQLIPHLCRSGNFEKAVALKDICLIDQPSSMLPLLCALIRGCFKSGRTLEATGIFRDMLENRMFLCTEIFDVMSQGYYEANERKKVKELFGVAIRSNLDTGIASYRYIVRVTCKEGKLSTVLSLRDYMLKKSNVPSTVIYNILIYTLFSINETSFVNRLVHELRGNGRDLDEVTYNYLVQGFCRSKDLPFATWYLKAMFEKDLKPSNRSLREVIKCFCYYGKLEEALDLSDEMASKDWVHSSVVQRYMVEALLFHGKVSEAIKFLDRMEIKGLVPENVDYNYLIKRLCQHGKVNKAVDLLDLMLRKGNIPESTSFDHVIQGFCTSRKLDLALNFHAEMLCRNKRPSVKTWSVLIKCLSEVGEVEEAEKQLNVMFQLGETPSRETYSALINKYRSLHNLEKASNLIHAMQRSGYKPDFETHWSLISNLKDSVNDGKQKNGGFLSRFLSEIGFDRKNKGG